MSVKHNIHDHSYCSMNINAVKDVTNSTANIDKETLFFVFGPGADDKMVRA